MTLRRFAAPIVLLGFTLGLSACSALSLNPSNWFQSGPNKAISVVPAGGFLEDQEDRGLISQVTKLEILRSPGGAIVQATGLTPRLGYWQGQLVAENSGRPVDGVLTFMFRVSEPPFDTQSGRPSQRKIMVGEFISTTKLQNIRTIKVVAENNSRSARR